MKAAHKHWRETGREFGYKECCIDFFCETWPAQLRSIGVLVGDEVLSFGAVYAGLARWAKFKNGHIPCPKCLAVKLTKKLETKVSK